MLIKGLRPIHPGDILWEANLFLVGISFNALAIALHIPASRVHEIVKKNHSIAPDTALRLARYFAGKAKSWLNLQTEYDLKISE